MISKIREKLSRFRSELHMGRYGKAIKEGETIVAMLKELKDCQFDIDDDGEILRHVEEELKLASEVEKLIKGEGVQNQMKINPKIKEKEEEAMIKSEPKQDENTKVNVGKWNKKADVKGSPEKKMTSSLAFRTSQLGSSNVSLQVFPQKQQQSQKGKEESILEQDEVQILEREVILPFNLPQFFKNREPHRLLVCHYQKCQSLIKLLNRQITRKKQITELQELKLWTPTARQEILRIYVAPFAQLAQKLVRNILEDQNNILILYSDVERQLMSQRFSNVKKEDFRLKF